MQLTKAHIQKFQTLYKERFGTEISYESALEQGTLLVNLMQRTLQTQTVLYPETMKMNRYGGETR